MTSHYAPLDSESLLQIEGADALSFLQGQTTCDTREVGTSLAVAGAYCTPQGRVVCDFLLTETGPEQYAMRMRRDIRSQAAAVFGKYIIFSKADLSEEDRWQVVGCWGPEAATSLVKIFGSIPESKLGCVRGEGFVLVQLDARGDRFECYLEMDASARFSRALGEHLQAGEEEQWRALEIEAGVGRIEQATVESFVPQMLNYDLTGHINFNKGCYTGQEVVARLHYRGTPKRRMFLVSSDASQLPEAGEPLYREDAEQSIGNVVNAARDSRGHTVLLVVSTVAALGDNWLLGSPQGPVLTLEEQPYALEAE